MNTLATDALFIRELLEGARWAQMIVARLHSHGIVARAVPAEISVSVEDRKRFEGERDIIVKRKGGECTIESKSRNLVFTDDPASFPFDTIIVDRASVWDKKNPEPRAIVFTSQWTGAMLVLPVRPTREKWYKEVKHDSVRNIDAENYMVPKGALCSFGALVKWMRG